MKKLLKSLGYILIIAGFFVIYLDKPEETFGQTALRVLNVEQGGTGTSTAPALDQLLIGDGNGDYIFIAKTALVSGGGGGGGSPVFFQNGGATLNSTATTTVDFTSNSFVVTENPTDTLTIRISTTTLGLLTTNVLEGSNLYYTDARVSSYLKGSTTIVIASTTRASQWDTAFGWGNHASQGYLTTVDISANTNLTAGDALTLTNDDIDFDGGATPSGDLGGTWASPSVSDDSHAHTGTTLSGIDISDDTNLAGDTEVVLTGDALSLGNTLTFTSASSSYGSTTGQTVSNLNVLSTLNIFGTIGTALSDFCVAITGGSGLCDGTDATGGGGSSISTSTTPTIGQLASWTGASTLGTVATTTITGTAPIVFSQPISVIGASPSIVTCNSASGSQAGCLASTDWSIFNNKVSTSSIDTVGELETLTGRNIIISTEIDESTELENLIGDEVGSGSIVFNGSPLFTGGAQFSGIRVSASSSLGFASSTALTVSGTTYLGSLTGLLKGTSGLIGTASNGTDYTLITGTTCGGTDKVSAISALGVVTCSADQSGGGGGVSDWQKNTALDAITPTSTVGIVVNASSSISTLNTGIASTTSFFGAYLASCTGASNKLTWTGGKFSCEADQTGGGSSPWTDGGLFSYLTTTSDDLAIGSNATSTAPFWFNVANNNLYIGNGSSADSQITFGPSSAPFSLGYDNGAFRISTSTTLGGTDLFALFSTSTGAIATTTTGMFTFNDLRAVIGRNNYDNNRSLLPLDTLNVNGSLSNGMWVKRECTAMQSSLAAAAISADTANVCGEFMFQEDTTGTNAMLTTGGFGSYYNQLIVANALPNDGTGLFLYGGLSFGSSTPIFKTVARIATPANASNTQMFLGFTDMVPSSTTYENFPSGCMFVASSTNANWQAYCGNVAGVKTFVDTGVPSTTSQTANANQFYRFSIYTDANRIRFYIATPSASQRLVAEIQNYLPVANTYNVGTYFATNLGGGGNRGLDVKYISVDYNLGI